MLIAQRGFSPIPEPTKHKGITWNKHLSTTQLYYEQAIFAFSPISKEIFPNYILLIHKFKNQRRIKQLPSRLGDSDRL